jgi:hypothetical protein
MQGVIAHGAMGTPPSTPTATPTTSPTGQYSFTFQPSYGEPDTFRGTVEEIRMMEWIPDAGFDGTVTPPVGGQFAVVLMTVTNIGSRAADVDCFSLRDDQDRVFILMGSAEEIEAQYAAEAYFARPGPFDIIMPGITLDMVFVFLVPEGAAGLVAERCPTGGY